VDPAADPRWERTWNRLNDLFEFPGSPGQPTSDADPGPADPGRLDLSLDDQVGVGAIPAEVWEQAQRLIQQARVSAEREARMILSAARDEADSVLERARADAAALRATAERDADQTVRAARERAEEVRESALRDLATELDDERERRDAARRQAGHGVDPSPSGTEGGSGRLGWLFGR
jgi:hypothetical protein